jgi:hypothetical protein
MATVASDSGSGNFKRVPAGSHIARCYSVADLGTHTTNGQYGETTNRKIRLAWEIFGEDENNEPLTVDIDGVTMPMTISKTYTLSLGEKASLRKDLAAWRGRDFTPEELKGFDVSNVVGVYCMLNVTISENNGKTYSNVAGISPLHKSMTKPDSVHKNQVFDLDNPDMEIFNSFYEGLQEYIKASPEWITFNNRMNGNQPRNVGSDFDDMPDDIPADPNDPDSIPF